jgi:uncharacterized membrane protein
MRTSQGLSPIASIALMASMLAAWPAAADFNVCNKSAHGALVAIAFKSQGEWASEGWWRIAPRQCRTILRGPLTTQVYYLHAAHEGVDGDWDGKKWFCVRSKNFSLKGRKNCQKRGLGEAGFFAVDTGKELTWVQNLSD